MENKPTEAVTGSDYRMRLRFRVSKSFASEQLEESVVVDGRAVTFKSGTIDQPLNQAKWLIAGVNGFADESAARAYGVRLRHAIQFASLDSRNGVDCGRDTRTSGWGQTVKQAIFDLDGTDLRDNIHGIDVFKNDGSATFLSINADVQVHAGMDSFLRKLPLIFPWTDKVNAKVDRIVILLNNVLMNPEPVAQIVLAISTIEGLGQDLDFTDGQKLLLDELAAQALLATGISEAECAEVSDAIKKIYKLSLRQGVLRLLKNAGLDLKKEWDSIYKERSTLVHGLAPQPGVEYGDLARRTVALCVRILHRLIEIEIGTAELSEISLANYET